ncbi:MAG: hypothetical protein AAFX01_06345 [Cyanobacteria bacterium J06638_28]
MHRRLSQIATKLPEKKEIVFAFKKDVLVAAEAMVGQDGSVTATNLTSINDMSAAR